MLPTATPPDQVEVVLAEAVAAPPSAPSAWSSVGAPVAVWSPEASPAPPPRSAGPSGWPRWPSVHRSEGTALQEFHRPAFHRQHFARLADRNAQFQGWLQTYNTRRRNHGDLIRDRTPYSVIEAHLS